MRAVRVESMGRKAMFEGDKAKQTNSGLFGIPAGHAEPLRKRLFRILGS